MGVFWVLFFYHGHSYGHSIPSEIGNSTWAGGPEMKARVQVKTKMSLIEGEAHAGGSAEQGTTEGVGPGILEESGERGEV